MKEINGTIYEKSLMISSLIILFIYLSPYYFLQEDALIRIHDNLDSNLVWYKLMADTHTLFGGLHEKIPNIMNGLPRNSLGSEFNLMTLLYWLFSPFTAYVLNQTLLRLLAFFGMTLLLKKTGHTPLFISYGVALCYALLPYWPSMGGTIAGLPLAIFAFHHLRSHQKGNLTVWLIVILLPFYSDLILCYVFFLFAAGLIWLFDWVKTKKSNLPYLIALLIMSVLFALINYRIIYEMFFNTSFVPHRIAFDRGYRTMTDSLLQGLGVFVYGQTHVYRGTAYVILPFLTFVLIAGALRKWPLKNIAQLFFINFLFSLSLGLYYWRGLKPLKAEIPIFETFNFGRFHFLEPPLWHIMLALGLVLVSTRLKRGAVLAALVLILQIAYLFSQGEELKYKKYNYLSYNEFYSPELFQEISSYIDAPQSSYRVMSLGIHPAVAEYNGFYTLDGYVASYSYDYKLKFRKIIAPELAKSRSIRNYFDKWGSRCYLFTDELGKHYMYTKSSHKKVRHLDINMAQFKKMGGKYLLAAVPVENAADLDLSLQHIFTNRTSPWKIYLYKAE